MQKVKQVGDESPRSAAGKYRDLYYGDAALHRVILGEIVMTLFGGLGGALGLALRRLFYPPMFGAAGRGVVFGRNLTIRHPHRIRLGDHVILDDNVVIDAKGTDNEGIAIGANVYVGRNTIIYTKNGNIRIGENVNISSNCQMVSSNDMTLGRDSVMGAYTYLLSGGGYDFAPGAPPFAAQNGYITKGPLTVGDNCWFGAGVTVLDGACIGAHCVIAAGAVVTESVPADTIVGGVPARVIRTIPAPAG